MQNVSHKTKLTLLLDAVDIWKQRLGSREAVAIAIVEAHIKAGHNDLPKMHFEWRDGNMTLIKNAADRIFRWLDDKTKDATFMPANFEASILAAMPEDLRLSYLNEYLSAFGLVASGAESVNTPTFDATHHLIALTKECSEANIAVAQLIDGSSDETIGAADRELAEAEEAIRETRADIRAHRKFKAVA